MRLHTVGSIAILSTLLLAAASPAADLKCEIVDPAGDPELSPGQGFDGAPYQDILRTQVERTGAKTVFSMDVAEPIPAAPELRNPNGRLLWMWGMSTGPGAPQGFPIAPGVAGALEFWIDVQFDGTQFSAEFIDRRPSLTGGEPTVTQVPFTVSGTHVTVTVPSSLLGDPPSFFWGSSTWIWPTHEGTTSLKVVDRAPNGIVPACPTP